MKIFDANEYNRFSAFPKIFNGCDFRTFDEYLDLNGIDLYNASPDVIQLAEGRYFAENWQWCGIRERSMAGHICYIVESLKSHSAETLVSKIRNKFQDELVSCAIDNASRRKNDVIMVEFRETPGFVDETCVGKNILLEGSKSSAFYRLIDLFLYYITYIGKSESESIMVYLEPVYTRCVTDELKANGKYAYHITDVKNIDGIRRKGLVPKTVKVKDDGTVTGYRYFPERTFYVGACATRDKTIENLKKSIVLLGKTDGYAVVEIDISRLNIDFWEDRAAVEGVKHAAYSYTAIPKTLINNVVYNVEEIDF